jgi:hypothetical protein
MNFMQKRNTWGLGALVIVSILVFSGCRSSSGSSGFASVEIRGHTTDEIRQTAVAVFREDGYALSSANGSRLVFERNGSSLNRMAYGSYGNDVMLRVRLETEWVTAGSYRLNCEAWMVRHAGDRILEDEQELARVRRAPFQKLLDETARRLK